MSRSVTRMTIEDAEHYTPEERQAIIDSYPAHEREARVKGIPSMGSGRVFQVAEEAITIDPIKIPEEWAQIVGIDFGWDHPTAACRLAHDRDNDCIYVCGEYAQREATPIIHAASIKPWGDWIPVAWPHDGLQHDKQSGVALKDSYVAQGLNMLSEKATYEGGGYGVEAGIMDMQDRMLTGRWKVFNTCTGWLNEFRLYHRIDGVIEPIRDDRISASRYAFMMRRFAKTKPQKRTRSRRKLGTV